MVTPVENTPPAAAREDGPPFDSELGAPYRAETLTLGADAEGPVVATLVQRRATEPTRRAILYVHGFSDYFFQTELAEFWNDQGHDFYALDLRKYGRSLLPHQTPAYVDRVEEYDEELHEAWRLITARDQHTEVLLMAHSTGGLVVPLWASRAQLPQLRGIVLNSPWFDLQGPAVLRTGLFTAALKGVGSARPRSALPPVLDTPYNKSLHVDHAGEFTFNTDWKPIGGMAVHLGWLAAIRRAHAQLHRGLGLDVPCLVLHSAASSSPRSVDDPRTHSTDVILDVDQIHRWSPALGRHVTEIAIEGGLHDLVLSAPDVRAQVYAVMDRWLHAWVVRP